MQAAGSSTQALQKTDKSGGHFVRCEAQPLHVNDQMQAAARQNGAHRANELGEIDAVDEATQAQMEYPLFFDEVDLQGSDLPTGFLLRLRF